MGFVMNYKVHRFDIRMTKDKDKFQDFLNNLSGEVVSVIPHVGFKAFWVHLIDFFYVVEKLEK